ncbi:adenylyltransferase and sulfurtransferase MOCS3 isoform X2 [Plodia interpunctella]|uniref:adenylyltransferase and sulfurtransferase MOCS3 isoform X2 n=1 Tax=Plodia interpunctella TaxID=58824 RepID=UPI002368E451|nr:adenylyltransferase and sulfurtransferase MOCS3 isoform X2 [Plodia interpunctella]
MDRMNHLESEITELRQLLNVKEKELNSLRKELIQYQTNVIQQTDNQHQQFEMQMNKSLYGDQLPKWAIERYSRQILLSDIGVKGQEKICTAKVLVVGAGGLGCPAAMYLAGAGVGEIGIVDYDTVELTNIHRQILHGECDQNMSKAESAAQSLRSINSRITVTPYSVQLSPTNAIEIISKYDIVLDCTDNVPTRYLLNDACLTTKKPLISGSALKMEGQLTIYGYRAENNPNEKDSAYRSPCYRCVFPTPPAADAVGSCSSNGVCGPVTGIIGSLQALEAIKCIVGHTHEQMLAGRLLLFDGDDSTFGIARLRPRSEQCAVCSDQPTITRLIDYEVFCKAQANEKKKQEMRIKSEKRKQEKEKRMTGQSYYGFRVTNSDDRKKWVQDVPKSERKIGPPCTSEYCAKGTVRYCSEFCEEKRQEIFTYFWNNLDWKGKKNYVRSLVDTVPPKRRRLKHKGEISRKGDSKLYHLHNKDQRLPVCRTMFLNTLGIKEAMVRCWLVKADKPKTPKKPIKSLNVDSYIENLPKTQPKCQYCLTSGVTIEYIALDYIKNQYQLYNKYIKDMKAKNFSPASRKTFAKVVAMKNIRIFKPKNDTDICDLVAQHNVLPVMNNYQNVEIVEKGQDLNVQYYYHDNRW